MSVNLEKELNQLKKENDLTGMKNLNEIKSLMSANSANEQKILGDLGFKDKTFDLADQKGKFLDRQKWDAQYEGRVYTVAEIKQLALDYNLRFLHTSKYAKDTIDASVASRVLAFKEKHKLNDYNVQTRFRLLAPSEDFKLSNRPIPAKDPILFYMLDELHYVLVHKWGNDFSYLRYVSAWKNKSTKNWVTYFTLLASSILTVILGLFGFSVAVSFPISAVAFLIIGSLIASSSDFRTHDDLWSSEFKD